MSANTTTVVTNAYGAELKFIPSVLNSYHNNLEELFAQDKFLDYNSSEKTERGIVFTTKKFYNSSHSPSNEGYFFLYTKDYLGHSEGEIEIDESDYDTLSKKALPAFGYEYEDGKLTVPKSETSYSNHKLSINNPNSRAKYEDKVLTIFRTYQVKSISRLYFRQNIDNDSNEPIVTDIPILEKVCYLKDDFVNQKQYEKEQIYKIEQNNKGVIIYYGTCSADTITPSESLILQGNSTLGSKKFTFSNITMSYGKVYFAYPKTLGEVEKIEDKQHNLDYSNSFNKNEIIINNIDYYCYILKKPCGASNVEIVFK